MEKQLLSACSSERMSRLLIGVCGLLSMICGWARDGCYALLRPVYTCDFLCDFAYKTRLTLPYTNAFFAHDHRVDWK